MASASALSPFVVSAGVASRSRSSKREVRELRSGLNAAILGATVIDFEIRTVPMEAVPVQTIPLHLTEGDMCT